MSDAPLQTIHEKLKDVSLVNLLWLLRFVVGLSALCVSPFSYQFDQNVFTPGYEPTAASTLGINNLLFPMALVGFSCLLFVLRSHSLLRPLSIRIGLGLSASVLLLLLVICAVLGGSESLPFMNFAIPVLAAMFCVLLILAWVGLFEPIDPVVVTLCLLVSFALSVPLIAVIQEIAGLLGYSRITGELVVMLGSVVVFMTMPPVPNSLRNTGRRPLNASARSLALVYMALVFFIVCTTLLRIFTSDDLETEVLYKTDLSKAILFCISISMVAITVQGVRQQKARVPWLVFFALCLLTLYFSIAFTSLTPVLCREVLFPSRMYAFFLLFVVSYLYGSKRGTNTTAVTCALFGVSMAVARIVFIIGGCLLTEGHIDPENWLAPLLSITALGMTVLVCVLVGVDEEGVLKWHNSQRGRGVHGQRVIDLGVQHGLTVREAEILEYISLGYSRKRIGELLDLSTNTVNSYAKAAYAKLELHGRQDAIDWIESHL